MTSVIFINKHQKERLTEAGVDVSCLTESLLRDYLTLNEYQQIMDDSSFLRQEGQFLNKLGFKPSGTDNKYGFNKKLNFEIPLTGVVLNAAYPNSKSVVLWLEDKPVNNTYDMIKVSLLNIVKAMASVLPFEEVKRTIQFKSVFLQKIV